MEKKEKTGRIFFETFFVLSENDFSQPFVSKWLLDLSPTVNLVGIISLAAKVGLLPDRFKDRTLKWSQNSMSGDWLLVKWLSAKWLLAKWQLAKWQLAKWQLAKWLSAKWRGSRKSCFWPSPPSEDKQRPEIESVLSPLMPKSWLWKLFGTGLELVWNRYGTGLEPVFNGF